MFQVNEGREGGQMEGGVTSWWDRKELGLVEVVSHRVGKLGSKVLEGTG